MSDLTADGSKNPKSNLFSIAKSGRPPVADPTSERSQKPWLAQGISPRTYYRRKAALQPPSQQHSAHVVAWVGTLNAIERLEYRAMTRRCIAAVVDRRSSTPVLELYMRTLGVN